MAEELTKNIQLKDANGVKVYPKTLGSIVINNAGENLGGVEAGAQVNKLEKVQLNGTDIAITNKVANIVLPAAAVYSVVKDETAADGMAATYHLTKDGENVGAAINIAKDQFVKDGSVKFCEAADTPLAGLSVGDAYIDLEFQVKEGEEEKHLYIKATDLVDVYTEGTGIKIENNVVSIDDSVVATKEFVNGLDSVKSGITADKVSAYDTHVADTGLHLSTDARKAAADSGITSTKVSAYDTHVGNADIHVTAEQKTAWSAKQDALSEAQLAAVNSGITSEKLATLEAFGEGKQDKLSDAQMAAVNSGITATDKSGYDTHIADTVKHITAEERTAWNGKLDASTYNTDKTALDTRLGTIESTATTLAAAVLYYDVITE